MSKEGALTERRRDVSGSFRFNTADVIIHEVSAIKHALKEDIISDGIKHVRYLLA